MLLGDTCTRGCRFCSVKTGNPRGVVDPREPERVAEAVVRLGLRYVVLTCVDRDDLPDGGAAHFARTIRAVRDRVPGVHVEALASDYRGDWEAFRALFREPPEVFAHNLETVERLTPQVRDRRAGYRQSLEVLRMARKLESGMLTKSSLMLGLGETEEEVEQAMLDLRTHGVELLTLGQYLQPTSGHLPVARYLLPDEFDRYRIRGEAMGFRYVAAGPFVRSSYRAGELFVEHLLEGKS
jgi:lipoic acid synthetase